MTAVRSGRSPRKYLNPSVSISLESPQLQVYGHLTGFAMAGLLVACMMMAVTITAESQSTDHALKATLALTQPGQNADLQINAGTAAQQALAAPAFPTNNSVLQTAVDGAT